LANIGCAKLAARWVAASAPTNQTAVMMKPREKSGLVLQPALLGEPGGFVVEWWRPINRHNGSLPVHSAAMLLEQA
jgi:hypothetical protein